MKSPFHWLPLAVLAAALAGCATTDQAQDEAMGDQAGETAGQDTDTDGAAAAGAGEDPAAQGSEVETAGAADSGGFTSAALDDPESPLSERVFYFEFDSSEVAPEDVETLTDHADYLATHPEVSVVVEGHTDERGSREYNLALGERRAQAVADILTLNGAAGDQVSVVSYGEEKPANTGHNDSAWADNRRVELVYER